MSEFVHLHVHSQYSMLDSALRVDALVKGVREQKMPAVALTDHGNMFGAVQFYRACQRQELTPILGCEVNLCRDRNDKSQRDAHHLVLLARNQQGYRNLVELVSMGWVEGLAHQQARVDLELVHKHREGLIALSGCMAGLPAQQVLQQGERAGREALATLRDALDPGSLFVELQEHGFPEQQPLNEILIDAARDLDLPLVATNDCHYLERGHAHAQLVLQCVAANVNVEQMQRGHHGSEELYLKSPEEMAERFRHVPEALKNTLLVAEMCSGKDAPNPLAKPVLPRFPVPKGETEDEHFRRLATEGFEARLKQLAAGEYEIDEAAYRERLRMEADVICKMGYAGYFLVVQDFINWAKQHGVPVGPGRGSGAGSLVAYSMNITGLDPIRYGLLFERFLNPERVSMPDFDIDFCMDRRDQVIDYVREKYGASSVGQIATFHLLRSRSVVRDVARVMGMTPQEGGLIATMIPEPVMGKPVPIATALDQEKRLRTEYDQQPRVKELLDTAMQLEGLNRHAGMHAAGVVISEGPLWQHVPVFCPEPETYVTQYDKDDVEAAGLVKFDFLGLKTLTTIDIACRLIGRRPDRDGKPLDIEAIPLDDEAVYALMQTGETTGVFQLESSGMQSLMRRLKPDRFEDVVALVALYRPGPMNMIDDYVEGKHGRKRVEYPHACLEPVLADTFGVMVYQEQVMQAAQEMAGFSLGAADLLRRAMGKKKADEMAKQKVHFVNGSVERGHSKEEAEHVFDLMSYFADYGFNRAHSAAYALIAYQCAYLKTHFPAEYLCATMTADKDKIDRVVRTVTEARAMNVTVLPPDVNESEIDFTVVYRGQTEVGSNAPSPAAATTDPRAADSRDPMQPKIRFGLGAVKGVGNSALEAIFQARAGEGEAREPFRDMFDFTTRVDLRRVNKSVIEALVQCGATDSMHEPHGIGRERAFAAIDMAIERGKKAAAARDSGQTDLFGMLGNDSSNDATRPPTFPDVVRWDRKERLAREKATLGFYVSGHPLDGFREELARFCNTNTAAVAERKEGDSITLGGVVEELRVRNTRNGGKVAFATVEDPFGRVEVIVRERALDKFGEILRSADPVLITGTVRPERERFGNQEASTEGQAPEMKVLLDEAAPLTDALRARTRSVQVRVHVDRIDRQKLEELRRTLEAFPGRCPVVLRLDSGAAWSVTMGGPQLQVDPADTLLERLERLFGEKVCELR